MAKLITEITTAVTLAIMCCSATPEPADAVVAHVIDQPDHRREQRGADAEAEQPVRRRWQSRGRRC